MVKEDPDGVDYHHLGVGVVLGGKDPDRIPVAASSKRPTKKKPKDKPKRPLSAYNFFFKEEREKILKIVLGDDDGTTENDPKEEDYIDDIALSKLRKDGGKVSFEEMGKLIGQRWKSLQPDRLTKYSEAAAEDTERYKKEMETYNGRQEARMRNETLKPGLPSSLIYADPKLNHHHHHHHASEEHGGENSHHGAMTGYDMSNMASAYAGYGYTGMEYAGYPYAGYYPMVPSLPHDGSQGGGDDGSGGGQPQPQHHHSQMQMPPGGDPEQSQQQQLVAGASGGISPEEYARQQQAMYGQIYGMGYSSSAGQYPMDPSQYGYGAGWQQ